MKVCHCCPNCGVLPLPVLETNAKIFINNVPFKPYEYLVKQKVKCKKCKTEIQYISKEESKKYKKAGTLGDWIGLVEMEEKLVKFGEKLTNNKFMVLHDFSDFVEGK